MPSPLDTANALLDQGKLDQAQAVALRALAGNPNHAGLLALLGFIAFASNDLPRCEHYSRQVLRLHPRDPRVNANLGSVLVSQARFEEALPLLTTAVEAAPADDVARAGLASALTGLSRYSEARRVLEEGLARTPRSPYLRHALPNLLHATGRVEEALPLMRDLVSEPGATPTQLQRYAVMHTYAPGVTPAQLLAAHQRYARAVDPTPAPRPPVPRAAPNPLRLALISPDFRRHSVAHVIEPLFDHLDRTRFHLTCYATSTTADDVTARLRSKADQWRPCATLADSKIADLIRADRADILIDLAALTQGGRPGVLSHRPSPITISYAGYPSTTGLAGMDYRIVDALTDPAGSDAHSSERLLRLDPCSTTYRPPENPPPVSPLPALAAGHITFASFSSPLKFNEPLIRLWSRLLTAIPRSRLILKHFSLADEGVRTDLSERFQGAGAPPGSVEPLAPVEAVGGHLAVYHRADIALDTYPYHGTLTTLESLLMGLPVVSLTGHTTASRMGLSLLTTAGLADLCVTTEDDYIAKAATLAADLGALSALRASLRQRLIASPLCDGRAFTQRFQTLLLSLYSP
jgi:protein O-GlcNAc transferase